MRVEYVWPDCDLLNKEWSRQRITSYWVRATRADLKAVLALAPDPDELASDIDANTSSPDEPFFLLVAVDLSSIASFPSYYPESGMWNGFSPFEAIEPVAIDRLEDLKHLQP